MQKLTRLGFLGMLEVKSQSQRISAQMIKEIGRQYNINNFVDLKTFYLTYPLEKDKLYLRYPLEKDKLSSIDHEKISNNKIWKERSD